MKFSTLSVDIDGLNITMGMLPITTSSIDELFSRINIDDFEKP